MTSPMLGIDLTGKRALVAGVADDGGFGFAIAKALAQAAERAADQRASDGERRGGRAGLDRGGVSTLDGSAE